MSGREGKARIVLISNPFGHCRRRTRLHSLLTPTLTRTPSPSAPLRYCSPCVRRPRMFRTIRMDCPCPSEPSDSSIFSQLFRTTFCGFQSSSGPLECSSASPSPYRFSSSTATRTDLLGIFFQHYGRPVILNFVCMNKPALFSSFCWSAPRSPPFCHRCLRCGQPPAVPLMMTI